MHHKNASKNTPINIAMEMSMDILSDRKQQLLNVIVEDYVNTAKPVGSQFIADEHGFDVSSATIRNEMKELEDLGYIAQPHTSAGRIPTAKGYRYYVKHFMDKDTALGQNIQAQLDRLISGYMPSGASSGMSSGAELDEEQRVKVLAKALAELSQEAVLVRLGRHNYFYTGISNIFAKPEFNDTSMMYSLSELVDHLDDVLDTVQVQTTVDIYIGDQNPISSLCSTVITEYRMVDRSTDNDITGVVAILGPMRMNYQRNYGLLKYSQQLLSNNY